MPKQPFFWRRATPLTKERTRKRPYGVFAFEPNALVLGCLCYDGQSKPQFMRTFQTARGIGFETLSSEVLNTLVKTRNGPLAFDLHLVTVVRFRAADLSEQSVQDVQRSGEGQGRGCASVARRTPRSKD